MLRYIAIILTVLAITTNALETDSITKSVHSFVRGLANDPDLIIPDTCLTKPETMERFE
jgi:hypothetical protein